MDDDDFYPPERISHAVDTLIKNPSFLIAGSSEMYIYFKHIDKLYQFGPYGKYHSTAATFAFRRELLTQTSYSNDAALAEEKHFLKDYTIPLIQLDPMKTILVFSHIHNSFDKKELLKQPENNFMKMSSKVINDFIKNEDIKDFFINKMDNLLQEYKPGQIENKPEVLKQIKEITEKKNKMIQDTIIQNIDKLNYKLIELEKKMEHKNSLIQVLMRDNVEMKKSIKDLESRHMNV
jgi:hypothetical protein